MNLIKTGSRAIRRARELGPRVLASHAWKLGRLLWLRTIRYWDRLEWRVQTFWEAERIEDWLQLVRGNKSLIGPAQLEAFRSWSSHHPEWVSETIARAEDIRSGRFSIFDQVYQFDWDNLPWHIDWRWPYTWEPAYYQTYRFYTRHKDVPYDVKFPWELSRFSFLLPLAQTAVITGDLHWQDSITKVVTDWEQKNPLAHSVNWQPMVCAIRGISLALVTQMLAADRATQPDHLTPLLRQLTLQGEFLFRNIEFTKVRGNHYTANLVGLLLIGCTLQKVYRPATRWMDYAIPRICPEIESQYCEDGVHFEKTTSYHRLVTEFFLLGLLVTEHTGHAISEVARERIRRACEYTRCYTRPDGLAPNWGDNDGAWLLAFDPRPLRDHRSLLALAAAYFGDAAFKSTAQQPSATIPWLLGPAGVQRWNEMPTCDGEATMPCLFQAGGMVVSRAGGHYLIADFGEVGKRGRGGHGHNDTFSFELCLCGKPLIVDPGSPVYTGDLAMMARYSSTGYHNTARVDGQEMARLLGTWRISNEASPTKVRFQSGPEADVVQGQHGGYTRLDDPVVHHRTLTFHKYQGRLICQDLFRCVGAHRVEQFLHFAPGVEVSLRGDMLYAYLTTDTTVSIQWAPGAQAHVEMTQVSENFGQLADSWRLVLEYEITGDAELSFEIALDKPEGKVMK